jgi:hypothetical protein
MYGIVIGKNNNLNIDHIREKVFVKFEKCQVKISQLSLLH